MYRENVKTEVMAWPLVPPERQSRKREPSVVQKKRKRANDLQTEYMACCSRKASTTERSSLPGSVSPSRRLPRRTKASIPSSSSRSLMCLETPGCEVNRVLGSVRISVCEAERETFPRCRRPLVYKAGGERRGGKVGAHITRRPW